MSQETKERNLHVIVLSNKIEAEIAFLWFIENAYRLGHTLGLCFFEKLKSSKNLLRQRGQIYDIRFKGRGRMGPSKRDNTQTVKLIESYEKKCMDLKIPFIVFRGQTTKNIGHLVIDNAIKEKANSITIGSNYIVRHHFTGLSLTAYHIIHNSPIPVNVIPLPQKPIVLEKEL
ncbi:hypothetical protein RF11_07038 [Thelohanellus kitauei]|uniref:UspA domain-containing protein n=1 Tax=Thelohanellus kitauei TaxID=669202 RepID=A0A0C2M4P5_THEKT|nr:hypothetical protein RF11_07038 [Thelohanellus kitauei]